jgi:hypothetical protein
MSIRPAVIELLCKADGRKKLIGSSFNFVANAPINVRFGVFTAVRMMMMLFRVLAPCRFVSSEDRGSMFPRNVDIYRRVYTVPKSRTSSSSSRLDILST